MSNSNSERKVFQANLYCDGHYTVISSVSRGGSMLSPAEMATTLREGPEQKLLELQKAGICLPIEFEGDCALSKIIVVVGELTTQEEAEWIGRLSGHLNVPCGKLLLLAGGGDEYDWENALADADKVNDDECFAIVDIPPGDYLIEVYAFLSSMTVAHYIEDLSEVADWFKQSRPGMDVPHFVTEVSQGEGYDLNDEYMDYMIRLKPLSVEISAPESDQGWRDTFTFRRPELCPLGILMADVMK